MIQNLVGPSCQADQPYALAGQPPTGPPLLFYVYVICLLYFLADSSCLLTLLSSVTIPVSLFTSSSLSSANCVAIAVSSSLVAYFRLLSVSFLAVLGGFAGLFPFEFLFKSLKIK